MCCRGASPRVAQVQEEALHYITLHGITSQDITLYHLNILQYKHTI